MLASGCGFRIFRSFFRKFSYVLISGTDGFGPDGVLWAMVEQATGSKRPLHHLDGPSGRPDVSIHGAGLRDVHFLEALFSGMARPLDPLLRQAIARDCADLGADRETVYRAVLVGVLDAAQAGERNGAVRDLWRVLTGVGIGAALGTLFAFSVSPWVCFGLLAAAVAGALFALGPKNPAEIALGAHRLALEAAYGGAEQADAAGGDVCGHVWGGPTRGGPGGRRAAEKAACPATRRLAGPDATPPIFVRNWPAMRQPALADMSRMPSGRPIGGSRGPAASQ